MHHRALSSLIAAGLIALAPGAMAGAPPQERAHELGWVCMTVSDVAVTQVSSFNKDAPVMSVWVTGDRFHVTPSDSGPGGRVCVPAIVDLGTEEIPDNTLVFEREIHEGGKTRLSQAEIVLTPERAGLTEATVRIEGLPAQWTRRDGVWTFDHVIPVRFAEQAVRTLLGPLGGVVASSPPDVFVAASQISRFAEPCRPIVLGWDAPANLGVFDSSTNTVTPRGIEPFRIPKGETVSLCDGLSTDGTLLAVARRLDGGELGWFLIPRDTQFTVVPGDRAYNPRKPLGGYHVCRTPTWTTGLLEEVRITGSWELLPSGRWLRHELGEDRGAIPAGSPATLLDYIDGWALIRVVVAGAPRTLAVAGTSVLLPSGPASDARSLMGGLCQWPVGRWRALQTGTQAFKVAQDRPGAELAGLWLEIPQGTRVLQLCQSRDGCDPIYVGNAQASETDRIVLVRYAGQLLGVRENDLRERIAGTFETRNERPMYWPRVEEPDEGPRWALGIGPGARLSFVDADDHAWTVRLRLQELDPAYGFEGAVGVGGNGAGVFVNLQGGVGTLFTTFADGEVELRGAVLGSLDLFAEGSGGIGVEVVAKAQLRWVNDFAPVSFEMGLNLGFGGTFGDGGGSGATLGVPLWLNIDILEF